ncbi:hypothetical protein DFH09DRAFT_1067822 [Mycena vulgaris]|nr:hypothetical protein DFH09DRAFT_1067822 [Mycena vulgaris]
MLEVLSRGPQGDPGVAVCGWRRPERRRDIQRRPTVKKLPRWSPQEAKSSERATSSDVPDVPVPLTAKLGLIRRFRLRLSASAYHTAMALSCKEAQTVYLDLGENRPQLAAHSTSIAPLCTRDAAPAAAERTPVNAPYSRLRMGILSHSARTLKAHGLVCIRSAVILPPRPLPLPHYYITLLPSLLMLALLPASSRQVRGA